MKAIVLSNNKGGVCKTTATQVLAFYYASLGMNVLVIDFDPQANLANRFLKMGKDSNNNWVPPKHPDYEDIISSEDPDFQGYSGIYDIFEKSAPVYPYPTKHPNISIIPPNTEYALRVLRLTENETVQNRVRLWFNEIREQFKEERKPYDIVLMDTPPSLSPLTLAAIRGATHAVIPCVMERKPVEGLMAVIHKILNENRKKPKSEKTELVGILPSNFDKTKPTHKQYYERVKSHQSMGQFVIQTPFYNREVIKTWDDKMASGEIRPDHGSPFESKIFRKENRRELEDWAYQITSSVFSKEEMDRFNILKEGSFLKKKTA